MKNRPIRYNSWRYKFAQLVLRLLYGRKWHFISPWFNGGHCAGCCLFYDKKMLLGLRSENVEKPNTWWVPGGYIDLHKDETVSEATAREVWEEAGLKLDPNLFGPDNVFYYHQVFHKEMFELDNECHICLFFTYEMTAEEFAQVKPLHETEEYRLFSYAEIENLDKQGLATEKTLLAMAKKAKAQGLLA